MPSPPLSAAAGRIRTPVFAELQSRIDALAARGGDLVPLHIGDTHLAPPAKARATLDALEGNDTSLFRYGPTAGVAELRAAMAAKLERHGHTVDPEAEIIVGNGGTHALYCAARAVLDEGAEVILASPYWPLAPGIFTACGAVPVEAPLTQRLYADPSLDAGALVAEKVTSKTRAIYLISPNNPDGKILSRQDLERIAEVACRHDLWVFSDEVYCDTAFAGAHFSIATLPGMRERTIVLHSLSKSHALAGARVGFAFAPPAVVAAARRVSTHSGFNVAVAMQRVALAAIADESFAHAARETYREARDVAASALRGAPFRFHLAEGATYLFLDLAPAFDGLDVERPMLALLEEAIDRGVLLAPGDAFGAPYSNHARLCYTSVPIDRVRLGCQRLVEATHALRAR